MKYNIHINNYIDTIRLKSVSVFYIHVRSYGKNRARFLKSARRNDTLVKTRSFATMLQVAPFGRIQFLFSCYEHEYRSSTRLRDTNTIRYSRWIVIGALNTFQKSRYRLLNYGSFPTRRLQSLGGNYFRTNCRKLILPTSLFFSFFFSFSFLFFLWARDKSFVDAIRGSSFQNYNHILPTHRHTQKQKILLYQE